MLRFEQLEMKYGAPVAYGLLLEIEKAARIPTWTIHGIDHETRLANAIRLQDAVNDNLSAYWLS